MCRLPDFPSREGVLHFPNDIYGLEEGHGCFEGDLQCRLTVKRQASPGKGQQAGAACRGHCLDASTVFKQALSSASTLFKGALSSRKRAERGSTTCCRGRCLMTVLLLVEDPQSYQPSPPDKMLLHEMCSRSIWDPFKEGFSQLTVVRPISDETRSILSHLEF